MKNTNRKWVEVDRLVSAINERRARGQEGCLTELDEYVDANFNK